MLPDLQCWMEPRDGGFQGRSKRHVSVQKTSSLLAPYGALSFVFSSKTKKKSKNQAHKEYVLLLYVESLTAGRIISACKKQFDHTKSSCAWHEKGLWGFEWGVEREVRGEGSFRCKWLSCCYVSSLLKTRHLSSTLETQERESANIMALFNLGSQK